MTKSKALVIIGLIEFGIGGFLIGKETPKALALIEKKQKELKRELTIPEKIATATPAYIPALLTEVIATATVLTGYNSEHKNLLKAAGAAGFLDHSLRKYKKNAKEVLTDEQQNLLVEKNAEETFEKTNYIPTDNKKLYYLEFRDTFIECTELEMAVAMLKFERNFQISGQCLSIANFYEMLELKNNLYYEPYGFRGCDFYDGGLEPYIDFTIHDHTASDGTKYTSIGFLYDPVLYYDELG